ncbi:MAG TPA: hypothetical protein PLR76_11640 [Hyphomonas sp.]|nr:hypothetical protein [Hyphomonas sp.]MCB9962150.1 hypothetical protein [Hyphomonas sp.]HPE49046.1 hypothetical protein [Hyphomonas sp.]
MSVMPIHRTRSGLILALLGLGLSLAAGCQRTVPPAPSSGDFSRPLEEAEKAPATLDPALLLPASERSILMAGHVAAGLALAGAGQAEDAAAQLRAAVGKIDPGEVPGLEALGYDPAVFEAAASALEAGDIAQDKLDAVGANMKTLRANAGGNPGEQIGYLMKHCLKEYRNGVSLDNQIVENGAYEDAYGYAVVARDIAGSMEGDDASDVRLELELLVRMWPEQGPVWADAPAPVLNLASQVSRVELQSVALQ